MEKGAILLMGLPGVGKGTQAFNLIGSFPNFVHVDTGAEIYRRIHDPTFASDPTVQKQREIYEAGLLNDPRWVANLVVERIHTYASQGKGLSFPDPREHFTRRKQSRLSCLKFTVGTASWY